MSAMTAVAGACGSHGKGAMEGADSEEAGPESFKWMDGSTVLTDPGKAGLLSLVEVALWLCYLTWTLRCNLFLLSYFKSRLIIYL